MHRHRFCRLRSTNATNSSTTSSPISRPIRSSPIAPHMAASSRARRRRSITSSSRPLRSMHRIPRSMPWNDSFDDHKQRIKVDNVVTVEGLGVQQGRRSRSRHAQVPLRLCRQPDARVRLERSGAAVESARRTALDAQQAKASTARRASRKSSNAAAQVVEQQIDEIKVEVDARNTEPADAAQKNQGRDHQSVITPFSLAAVADNRNVRTFRRAAGSPAASTRPAPRCARRSSRRARPAGSRCP